MNELLKQLGKINTGQSEKPQTQPQTAQPKRQKAVKRIRRSTGQEVELRKEMIEIEIEIQGLLKKLVSKMEISKSEVVEEALKLLAAEKL